MSRTVWAPIDQLGSWMSRHHRLLWGVLIAGLAALAWALQFGWIR